MVVLIVGLIMLVLGVVGFIIWGPEFLGVLKGSLPPIFALAGLAAIVAGYVLGDGIALALDGETAGTKARREHTRSYKDLLDVPEDLFTVTPFSRASITKVK